MPSHIIPAEHYLRPDINTPARISHSHPAKKAQASPQLQGATTHSPVQSCYSPTARAPKTPLRAAGQAGDGGCVPGAAASFCFNSAMLQAEQSFHVI